MVKINIKIKKSHKRSGRKSSGPKRSAARKRSQQPARKSNTRKRSRRSTVHKRYQQPGRKSNAHKRSQRSVVHKRSRRPVRKSSGSKRSRRKSRAIRKRSTVKTPRSKHSGSKVSQKKSRKNSLKKQNRRTYKFDETSNYFSSFDKFPAIKSDQEYEYEWRKKMFTTESNNIELQNTYKTIKPLETPSSNKYGYPYQIQELKSCTFLVKDFKTSLPNYQFVSGEDVEERTEKFKYALDKFTDELFEDFDWSCNGHGNVVIAGGCVNTCVTELTPYSNLKNTQKMHLRDRMRNESGDIDLFLINPTNVEEQIKYLVDYITEYGQNNIIMRTKNAITILGINGMRHVQIILRSYTTVNQLICGFDVDSCCFAYDGKDVITNSRGYRSVIFGSNIVDPYTSSKNGVQRSKKYLNRGYNLFLPFDSSIIKQKIKEYTNFKNNVTGSNARQYDFKKGPLPFMDYLKMYFYNKSRHDKVNQVNYDDFGFKKLVKTEVKTFFQKKNMKKIYYHDFSLRLNDYGYCLTGDTIMLRGQDIIIENDLKVLYKKHKELDEYIPSVLIGTSDKVMNAVSIPLTIMKNGSGNHESGSIQPIKPVYQSLNFIWDFKITPEIMYGMYNRDYIFIALYELHRHLEMDKINMKNIDILTKFIKQTIVYIANTNTENREFEFTVNRFNPLYYILNFIRKEYKDIDTRKPQAVDKYINIFKEFVNNGANILTKHGAFYEKQGSDWEQPDQLLTYICRYQNYDDKIIEFMEYVLELGVDVNEVYLEASEDVKYSRGKIDETAVGLVVKRLTANNVDKIISILKLFLSYGADFSLKTPIISVFRNVKGNLGTTIEKEKYQVIKFLIQNDARVNVTKFDYNISPLRYAARGLYVSIVKLLLDNGAVLDNYFIIYNLIQRYERDIYDKKIKEVFNLLIDNNSVIPLLKEDDNIDRYLMMASDKKDKSIMFKLIDIADRNNIEIPPLYRLYSKDYKSILNKMDEKTRDSALGVLVVTDFEYNDSIKILITLGAKMPGESLITIVVNEEIDKLKMLFDNGAIDFNKLSEEEMKELYILLLEGDERILDLFINNGFDMKTDWKKCRNSEEGTLMGYSLKDDIEPENIIRLNDGNCEDIEYFKDAAEAGSRAVLINPYTGENLTEFDKKLIINKFKAKNINTFNKNGVSTPITKLFNLTRQDLMRGNIDDSATLGTFIDNVTLGVVAYRDDGVYDTSGNLLGVVNSWDQDSRTLRDIDNNVLLEIERDGSFPDNIVIRELSDSDRERYEEENEERVRQRIRAMQN